MYTGIYVGDGKVIHLEKRSQDDHEGEDRSCHREMRGRLVESSLDSFLQDGDRSLFLFNYGISALRFWLNSSGACSTRACDTTPEVSVDRARNYSVDGDDYDHLNNNCETFAFYCKTGRDKVSL